MFNANDFTATRVTYSMEAKSFAEKQRVEPRLIPFQVVPIALYREGLKQRSSRGFNDFKDLLSNCNPSEYKTQILIHHRYRRSNDFHKCSLCDLLLLKLF